MESSKITKKDKDTKNKQLPIRQVIEFTYPVEISGDGEYLYITEIETVNKPDVARGHLH